RTTSTDLGADATLLRGRLGAHVTYYTARSHVFDVTTYSFGYPGIIAASGTIRNRGVEATITGRLSTGLGAGWDVTLSLWGNQNRLVKRGALLSEKGCPCVSELDQPILVSPQRQRHIPTGAEAGREPAGDGGFDTPIADRPARGDDAGIAKRIRRYVKDVRTRSV